MNSRFWVAGILLDIVKLLRQASLESARRKRSTSEKSASVASAAEAAEWDQRWWSEFRVAACWAPIAFRDCFSGGVIGLHDGVVGFLGMCANLDGLREQWEGTKEE